jgi:hypothetical protein
LNGAILGCRGRQGPDRDVELLELGEGLLASRDRRRTVEEESAANDQAERDGLFESSHQFLPWRREHAARGFVF